MSLMLFTFQSKINVPGRMRKEVIEFLGKGTFKALLRNPAPLPNE